MTPSLSFKVIGYVHPLGVGQAFLTPILLHDSSFWIQDISPDDRATGFKRVSLSGYVFPCKNEKLLEINAPALFAFYTGGGVVLAGTKRELSDSLIRWGQQTNCSLAVATSIAEFTGHAELMNMVSPKITNSAPVSESTVNPLLLPATQLPNALLLQSELLALGLQNSAQVMEIGFASALNAFLKFDVLIDTQLAFLESLGKVGFAASSSHGIGDKTYANAMSAAKSAPAGSDVATAAVKSAISAANSAFESMRKSAEQAASLAMANHAAATNRKKIVGE